MVRRSLAIVIALSAIASTSDPREALRQTEIAFAKAFAERDAARFFAFVADDATFMGGTTLAGKAAVIERWSKFLSAPQAPFQWSPDRVAVNAAGNIGLSSGRVYDAEGHHIGDYASTWVKQADGAWKILFDGPGGSPACLPSSVERIEEGDIAPPDGATLHYKKIGSGPRTLIVPLGFLLEEDFAQLADLMTIIAYDPRGRGRSSPDTAAMKSTVQQDVKDLETVRAHFKLDKFVPVGFSYLGLMVALYAIDHPEHVSRLVQLGPVPMKLDSGYTTHGYDDMQPPPDDLKRWRDYRAKPATAASQREACEIVEKVMRHVLVGNQAYASRVRSSCAFENEWPAKLDAHLATSIESIKSVTITPADLAKLSMPVLVIHGTHDRNAPYDGGREWARLLPNARLVTIPGAAHASWIDDPGAVFGPIREFVRGDWPPRAEKVAP
jgi:proline iminopeptidase